MFPNNLFLILSLSPLPCPSSYHLKTSPPRGQWANIPLPRHPPKPSTLIPQILLDMVTGCSSSRSDSRRPNLNSHYLQTSHVSSWFPNFWELYPGIFQAFTKQIHLWPFAWLWASSPIKDTIQSSVTHLLFYSTKWLWVAFTYHTLVGAGKIAIKNKQHPFPSGNRHSNRGKQTISI